MKQIDERLNLICEFINEFTINNGYAPTVREIGSYLKISSTSMIQYYLTKLSASGRIAKSENKNRTLSVSQIKTSKGNSKQATYVPLVGDISAGKGILAVENIEEYYPIPVDMFGANSDDETFMLKVRGQSMTDAGINDGDL
ncbi:MAG: transcriptional repressor LexA, partial [Clostridia bacterium]